MINSPTAPSLRQAQSVKVNAVGVFSESPVAQLTLIIPSGGTLSPALMDLLYLPEHDKCKNIYVLLQNNRSKFLQSKIIAVVQIAKKNTYSQTGLMGSRFLIYCFLILNFKTSTSCSHQSCSRYSSIEIPKIKLCF